MAEDKAWAEAAIAAADLVCWAKLIGVADEAATARWGTGPSGYAILQVAGEVTARQACLHLERTRAKAVEKASCRLPFCAPKQFGGCSYKPN